MDWGMMVIETSTIRYVYDGYPLVIVYIIENHRENGGFTTGKWCFLNVFLGFLADTLW